MVVRPANSADVSKLKQGDVVKLHEYQRDKYRETLEVFWVLSTHELFGVVTNKNNPDFRFITPYFSNNDALIAYVFSAYRGGGWYEVPIVWNKETDHVFDSIK